MNSLERAGYLAHAKSAAFDRRLEQAQNIVRRWLERCESPYVAFSAGKDSTVTLDLVRRLRPSVAAITVRLEWSLPETLDLLKATENLTQIAGMVRHTPWLESWADDGSLPPGVEWVEAEREGGLHIQTYAAKNGYDGAAIGLRADENSYRKRHIRARGPLFYAEKNRQWQCYPLASWRNEDVWAYVLSRNVPYNRAYDRLAEIGVPEKQRRIGPLAVQSDAPHDPLHYGQLAILKQGWPELYERFAEVYPEAKGYA